MYGAARIGDFIVNRKLSPASSGGAIILLCAALLALSGCGRKGPLDLPPGAPSPTANAAPTDTAADNANKQTVFNPNYGSADPSMSAPRGKKRPFALDPLLGN